MVLVAIARGIPVNLVLSRDDVSNPRNKCSIKSGRNMGLIDMGVEEVLLNVGLVDVEEEEVVVKVGLGYMEVKEAMVIVE